MNSVFFWATFQPSDPKKWLVNPTKGFLRLKKIAISWPKNLEVARFKQCVPLGC
jgi:hypothetical protein